MMQRIELGQIVATPGALAFLASHGVNPAALLARHAFGDWGDLDNEDRAANDWAVNNEGRILSAYKVGTEGGKVWIITEADRSSTCILLPDEY